jgi:hypothetical protein
MLGVMNSIPDLQAHSVNAFLLCSTQVRVVRSMTQVSGRCGWIYMSCSVAPRVQGKPLLSRIATQQSHGAHFGRGFVGASTLLSDAAAGGFVG